MTEAEPINDEVRLRNIIAYTRIGSAKGVKACIKKGVNVNETD